MENTEQTVQTTQEKVTESPKVEQKKSDEVKLIPEPKVRQMMQERVKNYQTQVQQLELEKQELILEKKKNLLSKAGLKPEMEKYVRYEEVTNIEEYKTKNKELFSQDKINSFSTSETANVKTTVETKAKEDEPDEVDKVLEAIIH